MVLGRSFNINIFNINLTWIVRKWDKLMHVCLGECQWSHIVIGLWLMKLFFSTINSRLCKSIQTLNSVVWEFLLVYIWMCLYRQQNWIWVTHIKCASVLTSSYYIKLETTGVFFFPLLWSYIRKHKMPLQFALSFPTFPWKAHCLKLFMGLNKGLTTFCFLTWLQYRLAVQIHVPILL